MTNRLSLLAGVALTAAAPLAAQTAQIDPQRLSQHVQTLGADAFEGRAPATTGETKTVAYLSDQFAKAGLQPGGDMVGGQRKWTQAVPLLRSEFSPAPQISLNVTGKPTALTQGEQIAVRAPTNGDKAMTIDEAPLVFVGYGVNAPERGWDDFKGLDAKRQDPGHAGQRPRFRRRRRRLRRQGDDLLWPLDLQI